MSRYTFVDVWHALKTQQNFDYVFWIDISLQILAFEGLKLGGFILVFMAILLITLFSYIGIFHVVPEIAAPGTAWSYFNYSFGSFLMVNVYFNYLNGVLRSPGYAEFPDEDESSTVSSGQSPFHNNDGNDTMRSRARQCKKCNALKMPRTHHCSICSKCVLR